MNRLLQGDVGAGKTAIAFAAALQAARAKRQTAVMAPTELLAEQHMETWRAWAAATGLRIELLTASTPKGVRQSLLALLARGRDRRGDRHPRADRRGRGVRGARARRDRRAAPVRRRAAAKLRDKGDGQGAPHLLVMTATPIPRTLALTAYGDLDVSVLDELPPGRQPSRRGSSSGARGQAAAYKLVAERVAAGRARLRGVSEGRGERGRRGAVEVARMRPRSRASSPRRCRPSASASCTAGSTASSAIA